MVHLSTVLFVDGQPVSYEFVAQPDRVRLVPDALQAICSGVPEISAHRQERGWLLQPELPRDLADQVLEDLERLQLH